MVLAIVNYNNPACSLRTTQKKLNNNVKFVFHNCKLGTLNLVNNT